MMPLHSPSLLRETLAACYRWSPFFSTKVNCSDWALFSGYDHDDDDDDDHEVDHEVDHNDDANDVDDV
jgi:hypothetical protein